MISGIMAFRQSLQVISRNDRHGFRSRSCDCCRPSGVSKRRSKASASPSLSKLGTNHDKIAISIACEFPGLVFVLFEPFAHFGHLDGEIEHPEPD
jgi:hypothetical protein